MFLGNTVQNGNSIATNDFTASDLLKRLSYFEKNTNPFYMRWYHRNYHIVKGIVPDAFIQHIKKLFRKEC